MITAVKAALVTRGISSRMEIQLEMELLLLTRCMVWSL